MHFYSSTNTSRQTPVAVIAIGCAVLSIGLSKLIHQLALPSWAPAPSALALFAIAFWLFDKYVWGFGIHRLRVTKIPNLSGTWEGEISVCRWNEEEKEGLRTRKKEDLGTHECKVAIKQTWSRISISFETNATESDSTMASLGPPHDERGGLRYEYDVKGKPGGRPFIKEETVRHRGVAHLKPAKGENWDNLTGSYYNDQDFQLWGSYRLHKVKKS